MKQPALVLTLLLVGSLITGCASAPAPRHSYGYTPAIGEKAARTAVSMVGKPYRNRGESPSGFDCSGLVRYSYLSAGIAVPHSTRALKNSTHPVGRDMRTGDLLFFNEKGGRYSHVGIYIGGGTFVHAPSSGQHVRKDSLQDPYWKKHFLEARRFS